MLATRSEIKAVKKRKTSTGSVALDSPEPRRTAVQQRAQDRIDAILAATEEAIVASGNGSLSIVDIAARAGITHTSIYHYFKSIEEILAMVLWRHVARHGAKVNAMIAEAQTAQAVIEAYVASKGLGWSRYCKTPIARGLWVHTRSLASTRRINEEYNAQRVDLVCAKLRTLAPNADHDAIRLTVMLTMALTVPTYEFAMAQPKQKQNQIVDEFIATTRSRLITVVGV
ncbi:MAG: TetR/AcrR family transcriptional regulator [Burkholderiales bacterium]